MEVERLVVGQMKTNCYLVYDRETKETLIIDPGDDADYIIRRLSDLNLIPKWIVSTHGHIDHILATTELRLAYNVPFLLHRKDLFLLKRSKKSSLHWLGLKIDPIFFPDRFIKEGDKLPLGRQKILVWETPGHTPGGISLLARGQVFSGDLIFFEAIGRYNFRYSSRSLIVSSIGRLLKLPDETQVYSGHGQETNIEEFRKWWEKFDLSIGE